MCGMSRGMRGIPVWKMSTTTTTYRYVNYQKTILGLKTSAMNGEWGGPTDNPVEIYDFEFAEPMYVG